MSETDRLMTARITVNTERQVHFSHRLSTGRTCKLVKNDDGYNQTIDGGDVENRIFQEEDLYIIKEIIEAAIKENNP